MLRISTAALLLFETGFQIIFAISRQAHPGQLFTMWCSHNIYTPGDLYWFRQTDGDVPITIVHLSYTDNPRKANQTYFNDFTRERLVADSFNQSTTLTIRNVSISDSGFYFCGTARDQIKFTDGTRLKVKENNSKSGENDIRTQENDHDKSPVSTKDACSKDIFFKLTLLFGGIIILTCILPLIWGIIREHKRQKHKKAVAKCQTQQHNDKEDDSVEYAAVHFSKKKPQNARKHTEDSIYTDTT